MRIFILIFFLLLSNVIYSNSPKRIEINYQYGWYPFGKPGLYHMSELYVIDFDSAKNVYFFKNYSITKKLLQNDGVSTDSIKLSKAFNQKISIKHINRLMVDLKTNDTIISLNKIGAKKALRRLDFKDIMKIANVRDSDLFPQNDDYGWFEKQFFKYLIKREIKSTDSLMKFITSKINRYSFDIITIDYYNVLDIKIFSSTDTIVYESNLSEFMGQPFVNKSDYLKCNYCLNQNNSVINLEINESIFKILPKDCELRKALRFENYLKLYILTCLRKI